MKKIRCIVGFHKWEVSCITRAKDNRPTERICEHCGKVEMNYPNYHYFLKTYENQEPSKITNSWYSLDRATHDYRELGLEIYNKLAKLITYSIKEVDEFKKMIVKGEVETSKDVNDYTWCFDHKGMITLIDRNGETYI
jgi:hypothetical protein